ncbi:MAG: alpha/beta hydrolase [Acidobacteria bacterium]|nr:MAG: alpha/beta hydrolase [Acidobacteriota bacterium]
MLDFTIKIAVLVIIIAIMAILFLVWNQDKMIFFPEKLKADHVFQFPFPFEEFALETEPGVVLNAIHAKTETDNDASADRATKGVVFYLHGNAGSLDSWGDAALPFLKRNQDVFIYDYRGYGKSTGLTDNESTLLSDAAQLFETLEKQYATENITIYGRSLGTGIACHLAQGKNIHALVLETPYRSFTRLVKHYYPFVPSLLMKYHLNAEQFLKNVTSKIAIIHGTDDEIIPFQHAVKLAESHPGCVFYRVKGGHHNDLSIFDEHEKMLDDVFLNE